MEIDAVNFFAKIDAVNFFAETDTVNFLKIMEIAVNFFGEN